VADLVHSFGSLPLHSAAGRHSLSEHMCGSLFVESQNQRARRTRSHTVTTLLDTVAPSVASQNPIWRYQKKRPKKRPKTQCKDKKERKKQTIEKATKKIIIIF
jgi:hypothetical protein